MKLAAIVLFGYSVMILSAGVMDYLREGWSILAAVPISILMFALAFGTFRGVLAAGYAGGVGIFLLSIYFAHRLVVTEELIPNGVFLMVSFLALFGLILGVFLGLQRSRR